MSKVNVFVIGAPKCGTTSLVDYLNQIPIVSKMVPKEPFFWSTDIPASAHEIMPRSVLDYEGLALKKQASFIVDGSTRYLRSKEAPKNIKKYQPKSKMIVMIRNPVEVAHAYHMEQVFCGHESELDFERAWRLIDARRKGRNIPKNCQGYNYLDYEDVCMFGRQLQHWQRFFPAEQMLIIDFEDFRSDPRAVFTRILHFLGLSGAFAENVRYEILNASHGRRNQALANLILYRLKIAKPVINVVRNYMNANPYGALSRVKRRLFHQKLERKPISNVLYQEISSRFNSDQELLSEIAGFKHLH